MNKRKFGETDLLVSEVGFGAWGIGGPAMAGDTAIGWGAVDNKTSIAALKKAFDQGVNFFDTADFYGLGHSEDLIGKTFGNRHDIIIATKVGHKLDDNNKAVLDYTQNHILAACEQSLRRLQREAIDYYQLHSARVTHLEAGECVEAMERLKSQGKIRYWGTSLNTYNPFPEAEYIFQHGLGSGIQIAFNVINQRALRLIEKMDNQRHGVIARMPFQFGLLTGKFDINSRFGKDDHRNFRLKPAVLKRALQELKAFWKLSKEIGMSPAQLNLNFVLSFPQISTVIPGIKTTEQAVANTSGLTRLSENHREILTGLYEKKFANLLDFIEEQET